MLVLFAALPIIVLCFLIIVLNWSVNKAILAALSLLLAAIIFIWQTPLLQILASGIQGTFFALEIVLIIFGAIFFLNILRQSGLETKIKDIFKELSRDKRILAIIIGLVFSTLIEGSAGFGSPAVLLAPILIILGFSPVAAVTVVLIGAAVSSIFGAFGLPIVFGFGAGLGAFAREPELLNQVTISIAYFNLISFWLACLAMIVVLIFSFGQKTVRHFKYVLEVVPYLTMACLFVVLPGILLAKFLGPELVSVGGGLIGLILLLLATKQGWLIPKNEWSFDGIVPKISSASVSSKKIFSSLLPYFLIVFIVFLSRADFLPFKNWLMNFGRLYFPFLDIGYSFSPFYSIGVLLILVSLFFFFTSKMYFSQLKTSCQNSLSKIKKPLLTLVLVLIFVKVFVYASGENPNQYLSMPLILARAMADFAGPSWPVFAPFIGALGSFITGGTTISNLLFSEFQVSTALFLKIDPVLVLSLQGLGAALGNMIAIHNVVVALAVVGALEQTNKVIRNNLQVVFIISLILGILGFCLTLL